MAEYIDRQTVLDALQAPEMFGITPYHIELINRIPAADVTPVTHAHWVPFHSQAAGDIWYCSACMFGVSTPDRDEAPYPKCFQEVLTDQLKTLNEATCELAAIMDKLGV